MDWIELPPLGTRRRGLSAAGLTATQRRWFDTLLIALVLTFAVGWGVAVVRAVATGEPRPGLATHMTANPLAADAPVPAVYLLDTALRQLVERTDFAGRSGAVRVVVLEPGEEGAFAGISDSVAVEFATDSGVVAPGDRPPPPGIWNVLLRARAGVRKVPDLAVLSMVPMSEVRGGRIGRYIVGEWPAGRTTGPRPDAYRPPRGLIRVTQADLDVPVSRHFRVRHFLTKGQDDVWPKYVLISPRLLDKLELTIDELNASGVPVERIGVISGFRTPSYNAGGGNTAGRGALSRHMYGDAMDWFVDNDGDGRLDDLDGDGRTTIEDVRVMARAAERVEARYPDLVGGVGVYAPAAGHAGFLHIDTRGYRARW
jgi:hypothetical protein